MKNKDLLSIFVLFLSLVTLVSFFVCYRKTTKEEVNYPEIGHDNNNGSSKPTLPGVPPASLPNPEADDEAIHEAVQQIVEKIMVASGFVHVKRPKILIEDTDDYGCRYNPEKGEIQLEKKLFKLCQGFKKDALNALALFIAHELVHHIKKHKTGCNFAVKSLDNPINLAQEKDADDIGGYWAWLADFPQDHAQKFFETYYRAYSLPDNLNNYEPMPERIARVSGKSEEIKLYFHFFNAANYLLAMGNYKPAQDLFNFIEEKYQGPELLNNLSIAIYCDALNDGEYNFQPFLLPFELQFEGRIQKKAKDSKRL